MKVLATPPSSLDVAAVRGDFPVLATEHPPLYLDSAATGLKPNCVIDAVRHFYECCTANIGRGLHDLAEETTSRFEEARETVATWINAGTRDVVFVSNCTAAVRLVAEGKSWSPSVLVSRSEHHSNDLPWRGRTQTVAVPVDQYGEIGLDDLVGCLETHRPALVAVAMVSNALGTTQPVEEVIRIAHDWGARVLIDASQAMAHRQIDVQELDCDFLCFSGHKMCGPSGVGVLYGKQECLAELVDTAYGGGSVEQVHADSFSGREVPWRLESGTPNIEGVIGLSAACEYLDGWGIDRIQKHVTELTAEMTERLREIPKVSVYGPPGRRDRGPIVSFSIAGLEAHAVARILSQRHRICVRSGYHCAQPVHEALGLPPTVRASLALYTSRDELDHFVAAIGQLAGAL